jgi:TolB-like protein/cytochrome c-type biogenesis protein CcmH/NrfG
VTLFQELKRRNVFKVGIAYAVTTWILLQLTEIVSGILELPVWAPKLILVILGVGFVPALILAWAFELTAEGIKLEKEVVRGESIAKSTSRKLDILIMTLLGLSLAYFIWESRFQDRSAVQQPVAVSEGAPAEAPDPVRRVAPEGAQDNRRTIAVLPFANRSAEASDLFFTDGIHDDLLTQLSKLDTFSVISRTSVMEYRDTTKNLKEIARELDVANIMEGAVQRAGNRVRINVQLIDADNDEHLWAEIYDRELTTENLFDIQTEIAKAIAGALKSTLSDTEVASMAEAPTANVAAYDLFLQARQFTFEQDRVGNKTALELYREALRLDPQFKLAWIGLADAHMTNYWWWSGGDPEDRDKARAAIEQARSIDSDFPELYMAEGFYWYWGHLDYERALYNLERAIEQMPNDAEAWLWHAWASRRAGLWDQSLASLKEALRLNPRVVLSWVELATTLSLLHRYDEATEAAASARNLAPDNFIAKATAANVAIAGFGDVDAAIRLTTGAQQTQEYDNLAAYLEARLAGDRFDEVLETAQAMDESLEVQRQLILLREDLMAQVHHFMGNTEASRAAADAAWFRLQTLRDSLGDDYRILLAEARIAALRGAPAGELQTRVERARNERPFDGLETPRTDFEASRVFALAGLANHAIALLEPLFTSPGPVTTFTIEVDPAFDDIRDDPGFVAMMEGQQ